MGFVIRVDGVVEGVFLVEYVTQLFGSERFEWLEEYANAHDHFIVKAVEVHLVVLGHEIAFDDEVDLFLHWAALASEIVVIVLVVQVAVVGRLQLLLLLLVLPIFQQGAEIPHFFVAHVFKIPELAGFARTRAKCTVRVGGNLREFSSERRPFRPLT